MGAQAQGPVLSFSTFDLLIRASNMAPMKAMKGMKAKAMSKGAVLGAIAEEHGLKRGDCSKMMSSLVDIYKGGEKDGHFHYSRLVPHQDPNKASNQSRGEEHIWQGSQSQGKASQDGCEGVPGGCIESSDLE